jgi:P27 family predicted phage terminase small subunit
MAGRATGTASASTGRTPKPTALRLLGGRKPGHDSAGRPVPPPPPFKRGAPDKPDDLSDDAAWLWDLIVAHWRTLDLLKPLDAASLQVACETYGRWKQAVRWRHEKGILAPTSQGISAAPWVAIERAASADFRGWCAEYGLTPAAESKIMGGPRGDGEENVNPFD